MDILVLGHGPVGKAVTQLLVEQGRKVCVGQRQRPSDIAASADFTVCDVLDAQSVKQACSKVAQVVIAVGLEYKAEVWRRDWPSVMSNILGACEASGARIVFVDNLYMYGPQSAPLREDMPLEDFGVKPAARSAVTRLWQEASAAGRVKCAAVRAPDFYGPGVVNSQLGDSVFGAIAKGKRAQLMLPLDLPHDFAYVPDIARAVITLLDAPDDAFGQAWHVPLAPVRTPREIVALAAATMGRPVSVSQVPSWMLPLLGLFMPIVREAKEMRFTMDRPYLVDTSRFSKRFWSDATPFEVGVARTVESFRPSPARH